MQKKINSKPLRLIKEQKSKNCHIQSEEALKSLISDFIIKECYSKNINPQSKASGRHTNSSPSSLIKFNKLIYTIPIKIMYRDMPLHVQLYKILNNYISFGGQLIQKSRPLEQIISDILQFIIDLQSTSLSVNQNKADHIHQAIQQQIKSFQQKRRKENLDNQYLEINKCIDYKNKKVVFFKKNDASLDQYMMNENTQRNSQRISRHTLNSHDKTQRNHQNMLPHQTKSKLKILIDSCNVFAHPERLQALKRQMLIKQCCQDGQSEYRLIKKQSQSVNQCPKNSNLAPQAIDFLIDWIDDISLSEELFKNIEKSKNFHKTNKKLRQVSTFVSENSIAA